MLTVKNKCIFLRQSKYKTNFIIFAVEVGLFKQEVIVHYTNWQ